MNNRNCFQPLVWGWIWDTFWGESFSRSLISLFLPKWRHTHICRHTDIHIGKKKEVSASTPLLTQPFTRSYFVSINTHPSYSYLVSSYPLHAFFSPISFFSSHSSLLMYVGTQARELSLSRKKSPFSYYYLHFYSPLYKIIWNENFPNNGFVCLLSLKTHMLSLFIPHWTANGESD